MNHNMQDRVIQLLKSSRQRKQRIKILRYELLQHTGVSSDDMIDSMTFGSNCDVPQCSGGSQNKIFYIMLNYPKFADALNKEMFSGILSELVELENEENRLRYYISLLDSREAQIIRRVYMDGCPWEQVAKELKVVRRTAYKIRDHALVNLAWMYEYIDDITGTVPAVQ